MVNDKPLDTCKRAFELVKTFQDEMSLVKKPYDLSMVKMMILRTLDDEQTTCTATAIQDRLPVRSTNITYNLQSLIRDGFIKSGRHEVDRRSIQLSLTEKGTEALVDINNLFSRVADKTVKRIEARL